MLNQPSLAEVASKCKFIKSCVGVNKRNHESVVTFQQDGADGNESKCNPLIIQTFHFWGQVDPFGQRDLYDEDVLSTDVSDQETSLFN